MKISWMVLKLWSGHDFVTELLITNFEGMFLFVLRFYGPVNSYGHVEPVEGM